MTAQPAPTYSLNQSPFKHVWYPVPYSSLKHRIRDQSTSGILQLLRKRRWLAIKVEDHRHGAFVISFMFTPWKFERFFFGNLSCVCLYVNFKWYWDSFIDRHFCALSFNNKILYFLTDTTIRKTPKLFFYGFWRFWIYKISEWEVGALSSVCERDRWDKGHCKVEQEKWRFQDVWDPEMNRFACVFVNV